MRAHSRPPRSPRRPRWQRWQRRRGCPLQTPSRPRRATSLVRTMQCVVSATSRGKGIAPALLQGFTYPRRRSQCCLLLGCPHHCCRSHTPQPRVVVATAHSVSARAARPPLPAVASPVACTASARPRASRRATAGERVTCCASPTRQECPGRRPGPPTEGQPPTQRVSRGCTPPARCAWEPMSWRGRRQRMGTARRCSFPVAAARKHPAAPPTRRRYVWTADAALGTHQPPGGQPSFRPQGADCCGPGSR